ncbi:hypothetical protein B5F98_01385 [Pseudoflavonifractor sp. An44]|nr:hypothetical protein B5F98_01385 [Pseudoflavonifractor sp. An44]
MTHPKRLYSPRTSRGQGKRRERGPLFFLCIFCLVGVLLGSIFAALGGRHPQFSDQLTSYFQSVAQGTVPSVSFWSTVWDILCWPLLLVLLSFGPPGVVGVPCVLLIRCFLLSYACSSFVAMFGLSGLGWGALFFGISAILVLPLTLYVAKWSFTNALRKCIPQESSAKLLPPWSALVCCGALFGLSYFLQGHLLPFLLPGLCQKLLSMLPLG